VMAITMPLSLEGWIPNHWSQAIKLNKHAIAGMMSQSPESTSQGRNEWRECFIARPGVLPTYPDAPMSLSV